MEVDKEDHNPSQFISSGSFTMAVSNDSYVSFD